MRRLLTLAGRPERVVVGLMSGTSADGVDAACVRLTGSGPATRVRTLATRAVPYPDAVRAAVLALETSSVAELARWNAEVGRWFARAALEVVEAAGLRPDEVDLIGSHGQTVHHTPRTAGADAVTLQIGEPCVIAESTGLPVVADFRQRDVAAGGEGAPLVPWVDWLLLHRPQGALLAQNLGGVGNVTLVTPRADDVLAFDTGPANGPLDAAAARVSGGRLRYDDGGALAAAGHVDENEVRHLLAHPFLRRAPPKSASRTAFGEEFVDALVARRPDLSGPDLVATLTEWVARSIAGAYAEHLPGAGATEVVLSGGGVHNPALVDRLRRAIAPLPVRTSSELGIDADFKEAIAFAVLANETICGHAANLPRATGARWPVVLGTIVP